MKILNIFVVFFDCGTIAAEYISETKSIKSLTRTFEAIEGYFVVTFDRILKQETYHVWIVRISKLFSLWSESSKVLGQFLGESGESVMCWWICTTTSLKLSCRGVAIDALWGKWDDDPRPYFFHLGQYVQMRQTKYIHLSKQSMVQWKLSVLEISNWSSREQQIPRNERNFSGVGETHSKKIAGARALRMHAIRRGTNF